MKYFILLGTLLGFHGTSQACTRATIDTITRAIQPWYENQVAGQMVSSIENLSLCDENLEYAGFSIGKKFSPPYEKATAEMASIASARATQLGERFAKGLAFGIMSQLSLPYHNPTVYMLNAIVSLGRAYPQNAKSIALELLKHQSPPYANTNAQLLTAVRYLRETIPAPNPSQPVGGSSMWAFRSRTESCEDVSGPWGRYEICPRYLASVSDQFGNRIVLACKAGNAGIEMRVALGNDLWRQAQSLRIETLAFGTGGSMQSLGVPYLVSQDRTLLAEEVLAPEVLQQLRSSSKLKVSIRANSGESQLSLNFTLAGSGKAIGSLLNVCR